MTLSRRSFLKLGGLGAIAGLSAKTLSSQTETTGEIETVHQTIWINDLPREFEDYRIGFITDTHFGVFIPDDWILHSIEEVAKNDVDLILLGGDHINIPESLVASLFPVVRNRSFKGLSEAALVEGVYTKLVRLYNTYTPPDGFLAVYGNHDRWLAPERCRAHLTKGGIRLLVNESQTIPRGDSKLTIVGVDDYWTGIPSLPGTFRKEKDEVRIILSHNPDFFTDLIDHPLYQFDFGLSGHTHGGQIKFKGLGALTYNVRDPRFREGLWKNSSTTIYTSRGIGMVEVPYRVNCPSEVTVFTLKKG